MLYLIIAIAFFVYVYWVSRNYNSYKSGSDLFSSRTTYRVWAGVPLFIVLFVSVYITGEAIHKQNNINNSMFILEELAEQRDELVATFETLLDNDEFVQLMEASVPEDIAFLKTNPEVSGFLLGRADRIVSVNGRLFAERNLILKESRSLCSYADNPLAPKLPFLYPECTLGDILELTEAE